MWTQLCCDLNHIHSLFLLHFTGFNTQIKVSTALIVILSVVAPGLCCSSRFAVRFDIAAVREFWVSGWAVYMHICIVSFSLYLSLSLDICVVFSMHILVGVTNVRLWNVAYIQFSGRKTMTRCARNVVGILFMIEIFVWSGSCQADKSSNISVDSQFSLNIHSWRNNLELFTCKFESHAWWRMWCTKWKRIGLIIRLVVEHAHFMCFVILVHPYSINRIRTIRIIIYDETNQC